MQLTNLHRSRKLSLAHALCLATLAAASVSGLMAGHKAQAQTIWTGAGATQNNSQRSWTNAANWNSGVPANDGSAILSFGTLGSGLNSGPYLGANWNIGSLFVTGSTGYYFGADYIDTPYSVSLATGSIIDTSSTASQTFIVPVTFTVSNSQITNYSSGSLYFDYGITLKSGASLNFSTINNDTIYVGTSAYTSSNGLIGGYGEAIFSGRSSISASNTLIVGQSGVAGTLLLNDSASTSSSTGYIGYDTGSSGTVTVTGTHSGIYSSWDLSGTLYDGYNGTGSLMVSSGGRVNSATAIIGNGASDTGTATVTGNNSEFTINGEELDVAYSGSGSLTVTSGGTVTSTTSAIGHLAGSNGTVTVSGTDSNGNASSLTTGGNNLYTGYYGAGTLNVSGGGGVTSGSGYIGTFGGSTGTVTVSGSSASGNASTWNVGGGALEVGSSGAGTLNITAGGKVTTGANPTYLSLNSGSSSTLNINGGSLTTNSIIIGSGSTPSIRLTNPTVADGGGYALNLGGSNGSSTIGVPISNAAGGAGGISKSGTGTLTLTGTNTYSGGTMVTGGTLALAASGADGSGTLSVIGGAKVIASISNAFGSGAVTLNNTTIAAGASGIIEHVGSLTITGGGISYLDFGAANSNVSFTFADSSANIWDGTLYILNDPTGDTLSITGLTNAQLASIYFINPDSMTGMFAATSSGSGSPLSFAGSSASSGPEPPSLVLILPVATLMAAILSRRRVAG